MNLDPGRRFAAIAAALCPRLICYSNTQEIIYRARRGSPPRSARGSDPPETALGEGIRPRRNRRPKVSRDSRVARSETGYNVISCGLPYGSFGANCGGWREHRLILRKENHEPSTKHQAPSTKHYEPRTTNYEPRTTNQALRPRVAERPPINGRRPGRYWDRGRPGGRCDRGNCGGHRAADRLPAGSSRKPMPRRTTTGRCTPRGRSRTGRTGN